MLLRLSRPYCSRGGKSGNGNRELRNLYSVRNTSSMPLLVAGTNGVLALKVSRIAGYEICYSQLSRHPDGEKYFRFAADVEGEDVVIFNSMHPDPDSILFETAVMAEAARAAGARSVSCVLPYVAYARSDVRRKGESLPVRLVGEILKASGVDRVYAVDFHLQRNVFDFELVDLTAMDLLARTFAERCCENVTVIAPDEHASRWARVFAAELGSDDLVVLKKMKVDVESFVFEPISLRIDGDAVIVDDIVCTGATISQAARIAKKAGCRRVYAVCTHAILTDDAMFRIFAAGVEELIATDTVANPVSCVSMAEKVAEKLTQDFG